MCLPEDKVNKYKELSEMAVQHYSPLMKILVTLKCTTCRQKPNIIFNREFEILLPDTRERSFEFPRK
jgi:hypothetical protein